MEIYIVFEYAEHTNKIVGCYENYKDAKKKHAELPIWRYIEKQKVTLKSEINGGLIMKETREKIEEKGLFRQAPLGLWKVTDGTETMYRITDDGCGYCNSIEEMSSYYNNGDEIGLVKKILEKGNEILFENCVSGAKSTYEEYLEQFKKDEDFPVLPYVNFKTYEKAKEIWDLLSE